jgi:hypothetical protein
LSSNNFRELSLLSKTELEWLLGNIELSGSHRRKIKSQIKKKLENFEKFELPLLVEKELISLSVVTKFGIGVTKFGIGVTKFGIGVTKYSNTESHPSWSNNENTQICAQMKSLGRDLIPRPFPYQGNALPG